ncbi:MAG: pantetheine-phosphate adenylyltransferase [Streptococcaceae bacterium]|nr:pantetheine-phosphate adenylyltransferase [Streptococcaceae bacterium]
MTEKIGLFTGSFDPFTNGHLDIVKRGAQLFDKLYIGAFQNDQKTAFFTRDERINQIESVIREEKLDNVRIIVHERDLTVNVAKKLGVTALLRSIRNSQDLEHEQSLSYFNQELADLETIILPARPDLAYISSTRIREVYSYDADYSQWVPTSVAQAMKEKRKNG